MARSAYRWLAPEKISAAQPKTLAEVRAAAAAAARPKFRYAGWEKPRPNGRPRKPATPAPEPRP